MSRLVALALFAVSFAATFVPAVSSAAASPTSCRFRTYAPRSVESFLRRHLPDWNVAAVPFAFGSPAGAPSGPGLLTLLRDGGVIGTLRTFDDVVKRTSGLVVSDGRGERWFRVMEQSVVDPPGLRHEIAVETALQPTLQGVPPFALLIPPLATRPVLFRYGVDVDHPVFAREFDDALAWLRDVLRATAPSLLPPGAKDFDRLFWSLASDPAVAPYVSRLSFAFSQGRILVRGTVPSAQLYDRVIIRARATGLPTGAALKIDTRTRIPLLTPGPCEL